ncbi:MAG: HAD-IIIC family phosphatase, partial [Bacteroidota bacterium]
MAQLQEAVLGVAPTKGQWIVALFPVADADFPAELQTVLAEVYQQWQAFAEKHLQLVDLRALPRLYALAEVHDSLRLDMAHIPYTEEFFAVAGVGMVRKMTAYRAKPLKVIAVDCDNTLWDGVCGEVGHQGIRFTEANLTLQRFLIQKQREGFLIVLASKNSEADVWAVFDQRADMLLTRDMITDWRINWLPKSENLLNLAQELSLGISSFVFIDDNPVECLEVLAHVLDVLTLPFPKTESALAVEQMLFQIWGLDKWKVTQEDQQRTQLYQEERSRKQVQQAVASETDFLARLQLRVSIHEATHEEVERVSQLTYRTNQFNVSQKRRSVEEIMHLPQEHKGTWVVEAEDQYGHYGIIGVVIAEPQGDTLVFDTFLMSCRALGRTIEDAVVYHLGQWAQSQGLTRISIPFVPTDRNEPARLFLNRVFQETTTESHTEYQQDIERLKTAEHITVLFQDPLPSVVSTPEPAEKAVPVGFAQLETSIPESTEIATAYTIPDAIWALATEGKQAANYRHFQYLTASALQALAGTQVADNDQTATQTALERLAVLFQGVLGHQDIPSDADFFSLGGHSLGATRLLSQIHKEFGVAISLAHFFQHPTLQAVHDFVVTATAQAYQELDAWEGEAFPLSKAQQRIWMLSQMRGGNQAYLLPALLELAGGYDQERLQQAFTQVIRRHENLRTRLQVVPGEVFPQQVVMPPTEVDFSLDLHSAADGETAQSQVETLLAQPISLTEWPAFRAHLIRQPEGPDWMLFTIHHFLADGWSLRQIAQEVVEVYRKLAQASQWQAQPAPFQYRHFVAWEKALPEQSHYQQSRDYWLQIYGKGLLPQTFLKMPGGSSAAAGRGGMLPVSGLLSLPELTARAKASQVSPFVYLLTGVQLFLGQYLQQPTTTVGTVVAGRDRWEFRDQVGLFVNTVLLHHVQDGHQTFEQHLQQAKANMLAAYAHQSFSYYDLVEELHRQGETQVPELHIMVIFNEFSVDQLILDDGVGVKITPIQESHSRFDLSFNYSQTDANLSLELHYNAAVFSPEEIEDFAKRYL